MEPELHADRPTHGSGRVSVRGPAGWVGSGREGKTRRSGRVGSEGLTVFDVFCHCEVKCEIYTDLKWIIQIYINTPYDRP